MMKMVEQLLYEEWTRRLDFSVKSNSESEGIRLRTKVKTERITGLSLDYCIIKLGQRHLIRERGEF